MEGRWTILAGRNGDYHGFQTESGNRILAGGLRVDTRPVPVVPCDDAAIERTAKAIADFQGEDFDVLSEDDRAIYLGAAEDALRAAGETP